MSCRRIVHTVALMAAWTGIALTSLYAQGVQQPRGADPTKLRSPASAKAAIDASSANRPLASPATTPANNQTQPVTAATFRPPANASADQMVEYLADMITFMPANKAEAELFTKIAPPEMSKVARAVLQVEKDKTSDNYKFAQKYLMAVEAMTIEQATPERRKQFMGQVAMALNSPEMDSDDLDIAVTLAEGLELAGDKQLATQAYSQFSKILAKNQDKLAQELSKLMAGAARRLNLVGNPIQIVGTTVEGKPFDWNQLRGRVVLVDFWATWCGPCIQEIPSIKKAYQAYHDKGFEVVAISLDEDRARLDQFLAKTPMPWTVLHETNGINPTAVHYGISAVPATLLVDTQGRVVSMTARGEELEKQLEKLLGPAPR